MQLRSARGIGTLFRVFSPALFAAVSTCPAAADCPGGPPVNASDGLCGHVQVTWPAVSGAIGYDVVRNTANSPIGGTQIATSIPSTFFNDGGAATQTTYFYFVRARVTPNPFDCASGVGFWGPSSTGWAAGAAPIMSFSPENNLDTSGCAPVIEFSAWNRGTIELYRSVPPSVEFADAVLVTSWTILQDIAQYSVTDSAAPAGQFLYWFRRFNSCGSLLDQNFSAERTFAGPPPAPQSFAASDGTACDGVVLTWTTLPGAAHFTFGMYLTPGQVFPSETFEVPAEPLPPGGMYTHIYQDPTSGGSAGTLRIFRMIAENTCGATPEVEDQGYAGGNPILGAPGCTIVSLGDPASLTCPVGIAFSYQWLHDGVPLVDDGRITGSSTPTLNISQTTAADVGEYVLRVQGACGLVHSAPAILAVRTEGACAADFDGNGTRDVTDIFTFLTAWFSGCP